jgi:ABC-type sugar transport system substrate-binding protein
MATKSPLDFDTDFDFGFDFSDDLTDAVTEKEQQAAAAQTKAETMYKMIMPLLNNLKKNPDKPNIVWPDREKKIDEFIKKLENVLKS